MKTVVCVSLLLLALTPLCSAVTVTEGNLRFSLESVKALRTLLTSGGGSLEETKAGAAALCSHPKLPEEFRPVCLRSDAGASMARLVSLSLHPDSCEICESVACTGC